MSKLYDTYCILKNQYPNKLYLFQAGIFYLFLDADARFISHLFGLKLVPFTSSVVKCGFPCSSFDKYANLFKLHHLDIKVIEPDTNITYNFHEYKQSKSVTELLELIYHVDINQLSIAQAYSWIETVKSKALQIKNGDNQ